jgi:hypothetical protein
VVLEAVKNNGDSLEYASEELQNDKEVIWISMKYFKLIKSIKTFDMNFNTKKRRGTNDLEPKTKMQKLNGTEKQRHTY